MRQSQQAYIPTRKVARLLDISAQTLYNWINQGKIPGPGRHPATKRMQWRPEDVEAVRVLLAGGEQ